MSNFNETLLMVKAVFF